jgi:type 1 glutamine amidotransferase
MTVPATESTAADNTVAVPTPATRAVGPVASILILTRTAGYRHTSIEPAADALTIGLTALGLDVVVDPAAAWVTAEGLAGFDAIVMLSTTGDWLDYSQQAAIEHWAAAGGGITGVHAATDAEPDWPFLEQALGARFAGHPAVQPATVIIEDATHPATAALPPRWLVTDEWYDLAPNPRDHVHVLATVDEATYTGGTMGSDHPIEWSRETSAIAGRVWYTAMGHTDELWADPTFTAHVVAGVAWTAGIG